MKRVRQGRTVLAYMGIVLFIFLINGCATVNEGDDGAGTQDKGFAPPIYYDFGDVRLPEELKVDKKSSFVYRTQGFSAGALVLEGRVERYSLIAFFENSMATEGWKFISSFNSPRTIMLFQKESRWCVINITDGKLSTLVEIWVAPTQEEVKSDLLK